jgi:hypothetical protein
MGKLLLVSALLVSIVVPVRAAADPDPRRGLRRAVIQTLVFDAFYGLALLFIFPRI